MKHEHFFNDFLANHVNLNQSRLDTLKGRVETITNLLKDRLNGYRKYSEQGSYAHKTIIKPVQENDEFDADILVFIRDPEFNPDNFHTDYVDTVYKVFRDHDTYKDKIEKNTRCVTINYAGDFHLDVVPCIEHENVSYICNRKDNKYEKTDGDGYKEWLIAKNQIVGGNDFRKATRLLKFLRDHKDNFSVKSILLTTILGNQIKEIDEGSSDFSDLPTTLKTLTNRTNNFLQRNGSMPTIHNPVLATENFNRHWDEDKYRNFRNKFDLYNTKINDAFEERNHNESVKKWRKLFGDDFGRLIKDSSQSSSNIIISSSIPTIPATKPYAAFDGTLTRRI